MQQVEKQNLIIKSIKSVSWTTLGNLAPRLVTPISAMLLAAILTPSDFGIISISAFVIALATIFARLGVGPAIVQRRTNVKEVAMAAFWISLAASFLLVSAIWIIAPWLAFAYEIPEITNVIRISSLSLILNAMLNVPVALLQREMRFKPLFQGRLLNQATYVLVSLSLAFLGFGYWALVIGPLVGIFCELAFVWNVCKWRPSFSFKRDHARAVLFFSLWVMTAGLQSWLFLYADNAIAGYFLGVDGLGKYSLGFNISILLPGLILPSIGPIAYSAFCALQKDPKYLGHLLLKLQAWTAIILFPLCLGTLSIATTLISLLYGDKWLGLGMVIQILTINGLGQIWSLNAEAYRAIGRPDIWPKLAILPLLLLLPLLIFAGPYGLRAFTMARFIGGLALPIMNITVGAKLFGVSIKDQMKTIVIVPGLSAIIMYLFASFLVNLFSPFVGVIGWLKLVLLISFSAIIYFGLVWIFDKNRLNELISAIRQMLISSTRVQDIELIRKDA